MSTRGSWERPSPEDLAYFPPRLPRRSFHRVTPLRDGREAFPAMLEAIAGAWRSVLLETYILRDDAVGRRFAAALAERARAGVRVRLMYDAVGSFSLPRAFVRELEAAGVQTLEFNPVAPWRARFRLSRRNHQKCLVVDDAIGFTGGVNLALENAPEEQGGDGWRDQAVRVEGPAVRDLALSFRRVWIHAGGEPYPEPRRIPSPAGRAGFTAEVAVVADHGLRRKRLMRTAGYWAGRRARGSILVMNAYFLPGRRLRRRLRKAVERGVDVRVIVPSESDVRVVRWASRHAYGRMLRGGVRIFEWPERMMHAKCAVVDGVWTTIGTYNLDMRSALHNLELGVVIVDRELGERMRLQFEEDVARCREVTLESWRRRALPVRVVDWAAWQLRSLL